MNIPRPINEAERLLALKRYNLLDTPPDSTIDNIVKAVADLCDTPIALVSIVDPTRQWFKSKLGLSACETPREQSFCTHAIMEPTELMVIEDATKDARFANNPLVTGDPDIRFYAGKPLVTPDGFALGTLCVIDTKPRQLSSSQERALSRLAEVIVSLFDTQKESMAAAINLAVEQTLKHGISISDPSQVDNPIIYCNTALESMTGYSEKEILGNNSRYLQGQDTDPGAVAEMRAGIAEQRETSVVLKNYRKDGSTFWNEVTISPIVNEDGKTTNFIGIQKDVSNRFRMEAALSQARVFLESAPDAMIIFNEAGEIKMANTATVSLFGYTQEELTELHALTLVAAPFRDRISTQLHNFINDPQLQEPGSELDLLGQTKSHGEIPIDVRLSPIVSDDGILISASVRDASIRIETERLLTKSKELAESASQTKSRFLAAASHDLRQPLQSIGMYLSVLKRQDKMPDEAKELCGMAAKSLGVMRRLLDALLDISMLEAGSITPEKRPISIGETLENILSSSQPLAEQKGLIIDCESSKQEIQTDPALLERILENFVSNAIRYTEQGHIRIRCLSNDTHMTISVSDTGVGIPANKLDDVFEEYYQLDNPARDRKKGLGLGLSIVKHIASLLDHPLGVSSKPGVGSTFNVTVPLASSKSPRPSISNTIDTIESQAPVILLVDDDEDVTVSTARLLRTFNMIVHTALSGKEAMAKISDGLNPDFLVSDFRLPHYDGVELIHRIRDALKWELPTVIMTGDTSSPRIKQSKLSNCTVLHKPFDADKLLTLIENRPKHTT